MESIRCGACGALLLRAEANAIKGAIEIKRRSGGVPICYAFNLDIYRSAKLLVDRHGEDVPIFAAQQADRWLKAGRQV